MLFTWATVLKTLVFTRGEVPLVERAVIVGLRGAYIAAARVVPGYERRDNFYATLAPAALLVQLAAWLAMFFGAAALMFWLFVDGGLAEGVRASGSSLFPLGVSGPGGHAPTALIFVTATTGIVVVALYIAYLPTLYGQFNTREAAVSQLESLSGAPPWGPNLLVSHQELGLVEALPAPYDRWSQLVGDVSVAVTHYPLLAWFRGHNPQTSWVTSLLAVLDSAAIYAAVAPAAAPVECRAIVHTSSHALAKVSETMAFATGAMRAADSNPDLTCEDFLAAYARLRTSGFPVTADPKEAWVAFEGQRKAYAPRLLMLGRAVLAPAAPWAEGAGPDRPRANDS